MSTNVNVNFDLLACENGTVWYTCEAAPEPTNIAKEFQERNIPINFAAKAEGIDWGKKKKIAIFYLGGPTGLFSNFKSKLISEKSDVPGYFCWEGANDFKDCDLRWFNPDVASYSSPSCFYFNANGNVYRTTGQKPFYQLVWKNSSILQLNAGAPATHGYSACYLSNGEVWVQDNPCNRELCYYLPANIADWMHLSFFDDKNVKIVLGMHNVVYILCEYPEEQRLFCVSILTGYNIYFDYTMEIDRSNFKMVKEEGVENIPLEEDKSMSSKTILKMVGLSEIVLCWCKEGVYFWRVSNGSSPLEETSSHPVSKNSKYFYPFKFFEDKNIIDVAAGKHFYVLCDDGVYTIPSKCEEDDNYSRNFTLTPLKLPIFDENLPVIFSSYFSAVSKLGKSARSRIESEEPEAKKQKVIDEENEKKDE